MKRCYNCEIDKSYSEFYKDSYSNDGYSSACKDCRRAISRSDYKSKPLSEKQKEDRRAAYLKWKSQNPDRFKELYSKHNQNR